MLGYRKDDHRTSSSPGKVHDPGEIIMVVLVAEYHSGTCLETNLSMTNNRTTGWRLPRFLGCRIKALLVYRLLYNNNHNTYNNNTDAARSIWINQGFTHKHTPLNLKHPSHTFPSLHPPSTCLQVMQDGPQRVVLCEPAVYPRGGFADCFLDIITYG